jgi:Response regulator containing a CheY-like receiver domain and an HTH DNA-binding domain
MKEYNYDFFLNDKNGKSLTDREYEVLTHVVMGKSNTEIAQELLISVHTAKAHVCSILQKMSVNDRVQAAVKAVREGMV